MRKNVELKKEWLHKIKHCEEYEINIFMMYLDDVLELTVAIDIDDEQMADYECFMYLEGTDEPTSEMLKKFKSLTKYFSQHFANVTSNTKVIIV